MSKGMFLGVDDTARKVKKMFTGVENVARKVKKGFIGVGGVARCFFSGGGLEYYGTAEPLRTGRSLLASATVGDHALFAGGFYSQRNATAQVDAYDSSLTRVSVTDLSAPRGALGGVGISGYALFGGGYHSNSSSVVVDAYNASLTRTLAPAFGGVLSGVSACKAGLVGIFAGAYDDEEFYGNVHIYTPSLTMARYYRNVATLSGAASVGNYAVFAGGWDFSPVSTVTAIDGAGVATPVTQLAGNKAYIAGASVGSYAVFAGGGNNFDIYGAEPSVDAYNEKLVHSTPMPLSSGRACAAGASTELYAIFGGGGGLPDYIDEMEFVTDIVEAYTADLVLEEVAKLSEQRAFLSAATIGDKVLFAGGNSGFSVRVDASLQKSTVDVYKYTKP